MKKAAVVIGLGEMGSVFARGLLRLGHPVYPVVRGTDMYHLAQEIPGPEIALVAVGEKDLPEVLDRLPEVWRPCVGLLQNELLPRDWLERGYRNPTVISVWFEKKKGQDSKVLLPSPGYGPRMELLVDALASLDIPARKVANDDELLFELVVKNVYIVTTNVAGLVTGGTVSELWERHRDLAELVASDVITIQEHLTGKTFDHQQLVDGMRRAFDGDPDHKCMGRSAPARLQRALDQADENGLDVPALRRIAEQTG